MMETSFYANYTTRRYQDKTKVSPGLDANVGMFSFGLYPGLDAISGYLNLSIARETYLKYVATTASPTSPVQLIVSTVALNFLRVEDDKCSLKHAL